MRNKSIEKITVMKELEKMENQLDDGANMVWTNFPYSVSNLAVIRSSLKELGLCHDNFRISFDENDIFIIKDNFFIPKEDSTTFNKKNRKSLLIKHHYHEKNFPNINYPLFYSFYPNQLLII